MQHLRPGRTPVTTLNDLVEMEHDDPAMIAEILPADTRLSFTSPITTLTEVFRRAAQVSPKTEVIPGTAHALLEIIQMTSGTESHLRLTASDGDQTVSVVQGGINVHMEGTVLVPAQRVYDILRLATVSIVKLEVVGQSLTIRSGRALWTVALPVGEKLTSRLDVSGIKLSSVPTADLADALTNARTAASGTNARVSLTQIQIRNGTITGCDGGRLHRIAVPRLSPDISVTIPIKSVDEIIRALRASDEEIISLGYDENRVLVEVGQDIIVAQRLSVPFPDVEPLILGPTFDNTLHLSVARAELMATIKRIRVNSDPDTASITLNIMPSSSGSGSWVLVVQARDRAGNASKEIMVCDWTGDKTRSVSFNHNYLYDMLAILDDEFATLTLGPDLKTAKSPILIDTGNFKGVIQQIAVVF